MTMTPDRVTRVAADLFESAVVEGARDSRSAKQQIDHWARVGRSVSERNTAARRRIEAVLAGSLPMSALTVEERTVVNAEIDAQVEERAAAIDFGAVLRARGVTTVSLDDQGRMIESRPDGTTSVVEA